MPAYRRVSRLVPNQGVVHLPGLTMLTNRYGNWQPFLDINSREEGRYTGLQAGLTTYRTPDGAEEEQYQTSYYEVGARADHLADPLFDLFNVEHEPQTHSNPTEGDARRLRKLDTKTADKSTEASA